jgi:hypothetical protein
MVAIRRKLEALSIGGQGGLGDRTAVRVEHGAAQHDRDPR